MSIQNILVAFNGSDSALSALRYAASLAGKHADVTVLLAYATHEAVNSNADWVPSAARDIIRKANVDILDQIEARYDAIRDQLGLGDRVHFMRVAGRVDAVLAECARGYDILLVGHDQAEDIDTHVTFHPDRIAVLSGRPVLVVPASYDAKASHAHAAVAWDGSRASARALSDSLGLLEDQGRVTIVTVGDTELPRPVAELEIHLARHGVQATHKAIPAEPGIARALIAFCKETDPCFLVMGAFEHSKFREDFLGGVTARVLKDTSIPVLISH